MAEVEYSEDALIVAFSAENAHFLGRGSFGETWCVEGAPGLPQQVAVKVLIERSFDPRRLAREVEGLQRFDSPGIVKLVELRNIDIDGGSRTALVCEHIDGGDVATKLTESGTLPSRGHVRKFAIGLLAAIAELHAADTWHRDIKPANTLLRDGRWRAPVLIDFGLSRAATDATLTAYPQQVGTLLFMSPEALRGEAARKQADLWSCGVMLYMLIAGKHPFISNQDGLLPDDVVDLVAGTPLPLPKNVPNDLGEVVLRLLAQAPHARGSAARALNTLRKA
ncbi:serine/threonine-protein kinase [Salinibacterium sp. M195]|uniref:serine/threonine-protein kinase n=1 Tax=Salinibacterium sp. M195 TaxID=2583374 RepID=UPI001C632B29|nr:serine/threonine-protein kinase [Salinibacterium sp. M195]QYH34742.1 serine/threonine protein kinase [Salinibacterium sp. M195]